MSSERIRLVNVSKSYYSETSVTQALRKINLSFSTGEFVAITGESGSGKSTLLHMLGGMDTFDDGEMYLDGEPTFQYDEADWEQYRCDRVGYVFQDYSLIGHYTVLDNIVGALLVMGKDEKTARAKAHQYLKEVGLEAVENHKATELSSGQKQRLSIARALAKETGILLADEPTGNLDSETGNQIIELMARLSKNRLVIMVTHNYDQVEAYVTRKIRIHDGEVISDIQVNEWQEVDREANHSTSSDREHLSSKVLRFYVRRNVITQKARTGMLMTFTLIVALVAFILLGEIAAHWDDTYTKQYSTAAFAKQDDTRLVVKKNDDSSFTQEELDKIRGLSYVEAVDSCDYANDVNYYMVKDEDYKIVYSRGGWFGGAEVTDVKFLDNSHYVASTEQIKESQLTAGRMPQARDEVVLASSDTTNLNKIIVMYFGCNNLWSTDYFKDELKVVGIIDSDVSQVYFTSEFCNMLTNGVIEEEYRIAYEWDYKKKDYAYKPRIHLVIADDLKGNEMRCAYKFPVDASPAGEVLFRTYENGEQVLEEKAYFQEGTSGSTGLFVEVSEEFFKSHAKTDIHQASVYISSYAMTDKVLKELEKLDLYAVSTIRLGMTDYDSKVVKDRFILIGICAAGLLALVLAQVLILRALMRGRVKECEILRLIGMKMRSIKKLHHMEMAVTSITCTILSIVIMNLMRLSSVRVLQDMMWYYNVGIYILFGIYVNLAMFLTVASFNGSLTRRLHE